MLEQIQNAPWQQAYDFLTEGQPPLLAKLLAVNTLFLILVMVRRLSGARTLTRDAAIGMQAGLIAANLLLLFQAQVMDILHRIT